MRRNPAGLFRFPRHSVRFMVWILKDFTSWTNEGMSNTYKTLQTIINPSFQIKEWKSELSVWSRPDYREICLHDDNLIRRFFLFRNLCELPVSEEKSTCGLKVCLNETSAWYLSHGCPLSPVQSWGKSGLSLNSGSLLSDIWNWNKDESEMDSKFVTLFDFDVLHSGWAGPVFGGLLSQDIVTLDLEEGLLVPRGPLGFCHLDWLTFSSDETDWGSACYECGQKGVSFHSVQMVI